MGVLVSMNRHSERERDLCLHISTKQDVTFCGDIFLSFFYFLILFFYFFLQSLYNNINF